MKIAKTFDIFEIRELFKCLEFQEMVNSWLRHESFYSIVQAIIIVAYISFAYFEDSIEPW